MNSEIYVEFAMNRMNEYLSYPVEVEVARDGLSTTKKHRKKSSNEEFFFLSTLYSFQLFFNE